MGKLRPQLPEDYLEWRAVQECRYEVLPEWLLRETSARENWEHYVRACGCEFNENGKVIR